MTKWRDGALVIGFHHAGGSSQNYAGLRGAIAATHDLVMIDLPGRGTRSSLPLVTDFEQARAFLAWNVEAVAAGRPYALFGHSLGGVLATAVARDLIASGRPAPTALVLSASCPPGVERPWDPRAIDVRDDGVLRKVLLDYGRTPPELIADEDFMSYFIEIMRADLRVLQSANLPWAERALDMPCSLLIPTCDPSVPASVMARWQESFSTPVETFAIDGGHFGLFDDPARSAAILRAALAGSRAFSQTACR